MADLAQDFIDEYNGKYDDFDGVLKAQCVDGYKRFCWYIGAPVLPTKTGWADGYWYHRMDYSKHVKFITNTKKLKKGDWLFWAKGSSCPLSHVGMFVGYAEDGYAYVFGQNQGGNGGYCIVKLKLDILGAFRFNALEEEPKKEAEWIKDEKGMRCQLGDGSWASDQWVTVGGKTYHVDVNGYMEKRKWITETDGTKRFVLDHGVMAASRWCKLGGNWYFFGKNGALFIGRHQVPVMFDKEGKFIGNWR